MSRFSSLTAAVFLSAATLRASAATAVEIQRFDKMAIDDRAETVSQLIQGAEKAPTDNGNTDQAEQVASLYQEECFWQQYFNWNE